MIDTKWKVFSNSCGTDLMLCTLPVYQLVEDVVIRWIVLLALAFVLLRLTAYWKAPCTCLSDSLHPNDEGFRCIALITLRLSEYVEQAKLIASCHPPAKYYKYICLHC